MITPFLLFAAGLLLGSFYCWAGIRIPLGSSVTPLDRSQPARFNVSFPYLLTSVATGLLFTAIPFLVEKPEWIVAYLLISMLIILSVSDWKHHLLPNKIIYPGLVLFLILRVFFHPLPLWHYGLGFLIGGGSLLTVSLISLKLGRSAMGGGDIKLMALMGIVVGAKLVVLTIFFSSLLGCIFSLLCIATGKIKRDSIIPYGPYIAIGGILAYFIGEQILDLYFRFVFIQG